METKRQACPRNCYSSCSMISFTQNGKLMKVTGDPENPYTQGRLCAKGYSYVDRVYHPERLKYPMYQKTKGSGNFERISWDTAFSIIENEWLAINEEYGSLLPVALYKYTGNLGVAHYAPEEFFSSIGPTTRIVGSPCAAAGFDAAYYDFGVGHSSDPSQMTKSDLIVIWGGNPAATAIHNIHKINVARRKGAKLIVIDPLYTKTASISDVYIQIKPGFDGLLANYLTKWMIDSNISNMEFIENFTKGFAEFYEALTSFKEADVLEKCDISKDALDHLKDLLSESKRTFHWIGLGFQRHVNGGQMIRAVNALVATSGMIGKNGAGVHYGHGDTWIFNNQTAFFTEHLEKENRIIPISDWIDLGPRELNPEIKSLWISCRNALVQEPQPKQIKEHLRNVPFVVTTELFMTETARWSNLVLPTTTLFEEEDIVTSYWHRGFSYNEQAIEPLYEAKSDYEIMKELAKRIDDRFHYPSSFPVDLSVTKYLSSQWNDDVLQRFPFKSAEEAKGKLYFPKKEVISWSDKNFLTPSGKFEFYSERAKEDGLPPLPIHYLDLKLNPKTPLQLLSPHDPHSLNSQFHHLAFGKKKEPVVNIHPQAALVRSISDGDLVSIFNHVGKLRLKAKVTADVGPDVVMIYQGGSSHPSGVVNQLVQLLDSDMGHHTNGAKGIAYYDTFVEVKKA